MPDSKRVSYYCHYNYYSSPPTGLSNLNHKGKEGMLTKCMGYTKLGEKVSILDDKNKIKKIRGEEMIGKNKLIGINQKS